MGIDPATLPAHIQKQINESKGVTSPTDYAIQSMKAKAVPHDSRMNKTERNYSEHLQKLKTAGDIIDWAHEPFNLRLADRTFYKPDFIVVSPKRFIEIHEVKGRWMDDALVKIKVAAENHPWFTFKAVFNENGHWKTRQFKSQKTGY